MASTNQYLRSILEIFDPYIILADEKKVIDRNLKNFITQKLFRKRFRKQKLVSNTIADIENKIKLSIERNKPLHFVVPFGGYKHFWNPSAPEVDWAEIFTLSFLSEWISPIIVTYEPGVIIEFVSEDWILERMNNYKNEDLERYCQSLSLLIETFNKHLPDNFKFRFTRLSDMFNKTKMLKAVEDKLSEGYQRWDSLSEIEQQSELKRSLRSVILKDGEGIDRVIESRIVELAYYEVEAKKEFSGDYFSADDHIYISFSFGLSSDNIDHWLTLGSTYASTVDFWVGRGILEENENGFVNRIVSREQFSKIKEFLQMKEVGFEEYPFKNLGKIEIIRGDDWQKIMML